MEQVRLAWRPVDGLATLEEQMKQSITVNEVREAVRRDKAQTAVSRDIPIALRRTAPSDTQRRDALSRFTATVAELKVKHADVPVLLEEWIAVATSDYRDELQKLAVETRSPSQSAPEPVVDLDENPADASRNTPAINDVDDEDRVEVYEDGKNIFERLMDEAELLVNRLSFIFLPRRLIQYASAREARLRELTPKTMAEKDVRSFFLRFCRLARRLNPSVTAEGYMPCTEAQMVKGLLRAMIHGYVRSDAMPYAETFAKETVDQTCAALLQIRQDDEGVFHPPWMYCARSRGRSTGDSSGHGIARQAAKPAAPPSIEPTKRPRLTSKREPNTAPCTTGAPTRQRSAETQRLARRRHHLSLSKQPASSRCLPQSRHEAAVRCVRTARKEATKSTSAGSSTPKNATRHGLTHAAGGLMRSAGARRPRRL